MKSQIETKDGKLVDLIWYVVLSPNAKPPEKSYKSAGWDLFAYGDYILNPGDTIKVNTGVSGAFRPGFVLILKDRSGMGAKGIPRFAGVIDWDYRGLIQVVMHNTTKKPFLIKHGDKICQGIFQELPDDDLVILTTMDELPDGMGQTERGAAGFGSTDSQDAWVQ